MMLLVVLMVLGGWEIVSAIILFGASLYGFLSAEVAEEIVVAEIADEIAEDAAEVAASASAGGTSIH